MKKIILGYCLFSALSAHAITFETMHKLNRGQTEAEVLVVAGRPDNKTYSGSCSTGGFAYQWLYLKREGDDRNVLVTFCGGKVSAIETPGWR